MKALRILFPLLLLALPAIAQTKTVESKITPKQIIELYRKAVGLDRLAQVHNLHIKASLSARASGFVGLLGDLEACYDADGRMWERNETIGHSTMWGYDGKKY